MQYQQTIRPVWFKYIWLGVALIVLLPILFSAFYTIDTGERGVVLRFGRLTAIADEGLNVKIPFVDAVKVMSIRDHNLSIHTEVSSSDIQTIAVDVSLVYALDSKQVDRIFQTFGMDIENTLIRPTLSEKISTFANQVAGSGIVVKSLLITNHDFSDDFNKAIEDKKIAEQGALTAKFTLERMKLEAEAQKVKQASLSPMVLQEMAINKWDGRMPTYFSGDQLPFVTIK